VLVVVVVVVVVFVVVNVNVGETLFDKGLRLPRFKSNLDEIWQECS